MSKPEDRDLSPAITLGDKIFNAKLLKDNVWLLEMHKGPRARVTWHIVVDMDLARNPNGQMGYEVGRVSKPRYGFRRLRFNNLHWARTSTTDGVMEGHLELPEVGHETLVEQLIDWVHKFY